MPGSCLIGEKSMHFTITPQICHYINYLSLTIYLQKGFTGIGIRNIPLRSAYSCVNGQITAASTYNRIHVRLVHWGKFLSVTQF